MDICLQTSLPSLNAFLRIILFFCLLLNHSNSYANSGLEITESNVALYEESNSAFMETEQSSDRNFSRYNGAQSSITNTDFSFPQAKSLYLNDYADLLDEKSERQIKNQLRTVKANQNIEITVITINDLSNFNAGPEIEPFATALFNYWGVGHALRHDGVLILIARNNRKIRIELGSGYDSSWDNIMKEIIDNSFIPQFKKDNYQKGILYGVNDTVNVITGENNNTLSLTNKLSKLWEKLTYWWFVIIVPAFFTVLIKVRNFIRQRPRSCHRCNYEMVLLDEITDNIHLKRGQRLEEYLSSVDYYVRHCGQCDHIEIDRYKSWFTNVGACPECQYITLEADTTILRHATTSSSGSKKIDYDCRHCGFNDSETVVIPRKTESSSSSGSSFGGGSSSGGGASGSW